MLSAEGRRFTNTAPAPATSSSGTRPSQMSSVPPPTSSGGPSFFSANRLPRVGPSSPLRRSSGTSDAKPKSESENAAGGVESAAGGGVANGFAGSPPRDRRPLPLDAAGGDAGLSSNSGVVSSPDESVVVNLRSNPWFAP